MGHYNGLFSSQAEVDIFICFSQLGEIFLHLILMQKQRPLLERVYMTGVT